MKATMAAAAIQTILAPTAHKILGNKEPQCSAHHNEDEKQKERQFVADYKEPEGSSPSLGEISRNLRLGASSPQLRLKDFELLKTIGTGRSASSPCTPVICTVLMSKFKGTFARVWLARLANCSKKDDEQVFALKIIRKVDSEHSQCSQRRQWRGVDSSL